MAVGQPGIVQGRAQVKDVLRKDEFSSLKIELPGDAAAGVQIGASVAINGTCLTVHSLSGHLPRLFAAFACTNRRLCVKSGRVHACMLACVGASPGTAFPALHKR